MDSDSWISVRHSISSRRCQSRSDHLYLGGGHEDTTDADDDFRAEFLCPFCGDDYDIVGLCCHIDEEHPVEAKNGVQRQRRFRRGGSSSAFSLLRKGALQSLFGGSSSYVASSNSMPDPLLSSFIQNSVVADESVSLQPCPSVEATLVKESSKDDFLERKPQEKEMSEEDKLEKTRRFEFVQGLLMSTILDD